MKPSDLDQWLKRAPVPERSPAYWEAFPQRVIQRLRQPQPAADAVPPQTPSAGWWPWSYKPALAVWGLGFAAVCLLVGFMLGFWQGRTGSMTTTQIAALDTYLREIQTLFPNQVKAIVLDAQGPRLVLSDKPDVAPVLPVFVKVCGPAQHPCKTIITFSGQQIQINGQTCEVLLDADGHVLLVGPQFIWSSAQPKSTPASPYRIEARPLDASAPAQSEDPTLKVL